MGEAGQLKASPDVSDEASDSGTFLPAELSDGYSSTPGSPCIEFRRPSDEWEKVTKESRESAWGDVEEDKDPFVESVSYTARSSSLRLTVSNVMISMLYNEAGNDDLFMKKIDEMAGDDATLVSKKDIAGHPARVYEHYENISIETYQQDVYMLMNDKYAAVISLAYDLPSKYREQDTLALETMLKEICESVRFKE